MHARNAQEHVCAHQCGRDGVPEKSGTCSAICWRKGVALPALNAWRGRTRVSAERPVIARTCEECAWFCMCERQRSVARRVLYAWRLRAVDYAWCPTGPRARALLASYAHFPFANEARP
eukprot:7391919-Prymnesium_polylepis.3